MVAPAAGARDLFDRDLRLAHKAAQSAVTPSRIRDYNAIWHRLWVPYTRSLGHTDPLLTQITDKIPILQVFCERIRDGRLSLSGKPVRSDRVATTLQALSLIHI